MPDERHPFERMAAILIGQMPQLDADGREIGTVSGKTDATALVDLSKVMQEITEEGPMDILTDWGAPERDTREFD